MAFYLPSEWHSQSAVLLTWPHQNTDWQANLADITTVYINLAKHISERQIVVIGCHDQPLQNQVTSLLTQHNVNLNNVRFYIAPCNDTWARDHGPITLLDDNGDSQICDFEFNAWGSKYEANHDNLLTQALIQQPFVNLCHYQTYDFVLEGGSIESDGNGTVLTTTRCLLNKNRNPKFNQQQIDQGLKELLGAQQIHWLEHGYLPGDDTDAHIDTLARFAPNGIVYVSSDDSSLEHYQELKQMEQELNGLTDINGNPYSLYPLPSPAEVLNADGDALPATYANFLIINEAVLMPSYNDKNDALAQQILGKAFPDHQIIAVDCRAVIEQFGSLHCLTMQLPEGLIE